MSNEDIVMLSDTDFDNQVLKSDEPVLVDFYANWCAPCRELDEVTFHHPDINF